MGRKKHYIIFLGICLCCGSLFTACKVNDTEVNTKEKMGEAAISAGESIPEPTEAPKQDDLNKENEEQFYEAAASLGVGEKEAADYFGALLKNNVFQNGKMELAGLFIDDIDGNGQMDMIVRVKASEAEYLEYGMGCIYFYMNEDNPYCFSDDSLPYFGSWSISYGDIDNDEDVEIIIEMQGMGVGAAGDWYPIILKYKNNGGFESMELPTDLDPDYFPGIEIKINQEPQENTYSAYCPYLDETIMFQAPNIDNEYFKVPEISTEVGGNARGFFILMCVEYEGENALQASEYLYGEGGIVHCIGLAEFIITWDEEGKGHVVKWWIEPDELSLD